MAEAQARKQNWQAAINQVEQFASDVDRLARARRLPDEHRARLLETARQLMAEIEAARQEDDPGTRLGPKLRRVPPETAPSCPSGPPVPRG